MCEKTDEIKVVLSRSANERKEHEEKKAGNYVRGAKFQPSNASESLELEVDESII